MSRLLLCEDCTLCDGVRSAVTRMPTIRHSVHSLVLGLVPFKASEYFTGS